MLCRIGDVEVWRILEMVEPFRAPTDLFPTAGPDVSARIENLAPGSICPKTKRLILPIQGYLLKTPDAIVLVDACVGNHKTNPNVPIWHQRDDPRFMAALAAAGVTPDDVDYVLCTHLHSDHNGWNTQLKDGRWVPTFPNAKYLMPSADEAFAQQSRGQMYQENVLPVVQAGQVEFVGADHALGDQITLIPTPGHTPGHVSVRIKSGMAEAVITGDALHTTAQCWHPEWHFTYDDDPEMAVVSRRKLLETVSEAGCRVLGSHFTLPSIGRVKATSDGFKWVGDGD